MEDKKRIRRAPRKQEIQEAGGPNAALEPGADPETEKGHLWQSHINSQD